MAKTPGAAATLPTHPEFQNALKQTHLWLEALLKKKQPGVKIPANVRQTMRIFPKILKFWSAAPNAKLYAALTGAEPVATTKKPAMRAGSKTQTAAG